MKIEKLSPTEQKLLGATAKRQKTAAWLDRFTLFGILGRRDLEFSGELSFRETITFRAFSRSVVKEDVTAEALAACVKTIRVGRWNVDLGRGR